MAIFLVKSTTVSLLFVGKSFWFVVVKDKKEVIRTLAEKAIEQRYFIKGP